MKIPKLKFFYHALNESDYEEFCRTRTIQARTQATMNLATGIITNTTRLMYFYSSAGVADTRYRQVNHYQHHPVWVLRVPRECMTTSRLISAPDPRGMWISEDPITVPHCAVERFELAPDAPIQTQTLARSQPHMITLDTR